MELNKEQPEIAAAKRRHQDAATVAHYAGAQARQATEDAADAQRLHDAAPQQHNARRIAIGAARIAYGTHKTAALAYETTAAALEEAATIYRRIADDHEQQASAYLPGLPTK